MLVVRQELIERSLPVQPGSPPMAQLDQERTKSTYGLQWNRFRIIRADEDRATFRNRTGLHPIDLEGQFVLDAGCGMGRYLRIAAESSASLVVGLDLSHAVVAARELTTGLAKVAVVRGDLLKLPFPPASFDQIYSLGVLDHTPDPRAAFLGLAGLLKPGGKIAVWVYPRERSEVEWIMNFQRAFSTRLPLPLLELLCRMAVPIGGLKRKLMASPWRVCERLGVALHLATIGVSMHPDPTVRACDTLDWYAPKYMSRHTFDEIASWFRDAGLTDLVDLTRDQVFFHKGQGNGINLSGRRPRDLV
jgi:SAM-dependent methyltransferase